ncbi:hypothetical protein EVA_08736 [gut metagenome]|uniref:Uncharacterized protein n=1 Tax=gut metagenome TaxID=749906 RepID=J9G7E6_9ZZZZ
MLSNHLLNLNRPIAEAVGRFFIGRMMTFFARKTLFGGCILC